MGCALAGTGALAEDWAGPPPEGGLRTVDITSALPERGTEGRGTEAEETAVVERGGRPGMTPRLLMECGIPGGSASGYHATVGTDVMGVR